MKNKIEPQFSYLLNQEHTPENQPNGSYRYALNAISDRHSLSSISTELGNKKCLDFDGNIVGSIAINPIRTIVFTDNNSIYDVDLDQCTSTLLVTLDCFNFDTSSPIKGQYRKVRGCDDVIYWNDDGRNPDRFFNISSPDEFKKPNGAWDCDAFEFTPCVTHPVITTEVLRTGGQLDFGTYQFAVETLDENQNILFVSPIDVNYTPIEKDSLSSIRIVINNLEGTYARIIVFRSTTGDGITTDAHVIGNILPIDNNSVQYIYSGFNPNNGDFLVDKNQYLVPNVLYKSSAVMEQVSGRLLRANLKETVRDVSDYQKFASKIRVRPVVKYESILDDNIAILSQTFRGGQVVVPGIVYVHCDGTISDVYPIPGRQKRINDSEIIAVEIPQNELYGYRISNIEKTQPSGTQVSLTFKTSSPIINGSVRMTLAGEVSEVTDLTNPIIFNFSSSFFTFAAPTATFEILSNNVVVDTSTIVFSEPSGYSGSFKITETAEFEKWKLQDTSSLSVDQLAQYDFTYEPGYYEISQEYVNPPNYCNDDENYWGNDYNGDPLTGKIRYVVIPDKSTHQIYDNSRQISRIGLHFDNIEYPSTDIVGHYFVTSVIDEFNSNIVDKGFLFPFGCLGDCDEGRYLHNVDGNTYDPTSLYYNYVSPEILVNNNFKQGEFIIEESTVSETVTETDKTYSNIFDSDLPYDDLELYEKQHNLQEYFVGNNDISVIQESLKLLTRSNFNDLNNFSYSNTFNILELQEALPLNVNSLIRYISIRRTTEVFPNIWAIRFRRITNLNENFSFRGEHFNSLFDFSNISWLNVSDRNFVQTITFSDSVVKCEFELFKNVFVESRVNTFLRYQGDNECDQFYNRKRDDFEFIKNRVIEPFDKGHKVRESVCPFWPGYSQDYSITQQLNLYTPLPFGYDFCSDCQGEYPTRIIWSNKSFDENLTDQYRVFEPNNFIDLPANTGQIIDMDFKGNNLIIRTEYSCYFISPTPQQLQTNENTVFIGTGDFLSLEPQELNITPKGFGGQKHRCESIITERGIIWIDRNRGKIFLLSDGMDELSRKGMFSWFYENLREGDDFCVLAYDSENERLIITRRNNWTISYNFNTQGWTGWHSYIPNNYVCSSTTFFSEDSQALWSHNNKELPCNFYGTQYPFEIEFIGNNYNTFKPDSIHYYAKASNYVNDQWIDDFKTTFNKVLVYNDNQSSGEIELEYLDKHEESIFSNNYVKQSNRDYKISPVCDNATDANLFTTDISSVKNGQHGWADKVSLITEELNQSEQGYFRGKWVAIRLSFLQEGYRFTMNLLKIFEHYMIR